MKAKELRGKTGEDLTGLETELTEELFRLRFRKGAGQLSNTSRLVQVRRDLARVKTLKHERRSAI